MLKRGEETGAGYRLFTLHLETKAVVPVADFEAGLSVAGVELDRFLRKIEAYLGTPVALKGSRL